MKFKEWKDKKKKFHQKTIKECFSKEKAPPEAIQKEFVFDQDFENKKQLADEKKQKEMEERKNRKYEWRQEIVAKNKELKRIKKEEKNNRCEKIKEPMQK